MVTYDTLIFAKWGIILFLFGSFGSKAGKSFILLSSGFPVAGVAFLGSLSAGVGVPLETTVLAP